MSIQLTSICSLRTMPGHPGSENDLVISYGHGDNPGWSSELLFVERLVPVAAPGYLQTLNISGDSNADSKGNVARSGFGDCIGDDSFVSASFAYPLLRQLADALFMGSNECRRT